MEDFDFEDPNILVGDDNLISHNPDRKTVCPELADSAWKSWIQVADKGVSLGNNGILYCEWGNTNRQHNDGLKDTQMYVTGYRYLFNLLLKNGKISLNSDQERTAFLLSARGNLTQSLWLEYYLLRNISVLSELGFTPPQKRQYRPGKVSAKLFTWIENVWAIAKLEQCPYCQWILNYDSPAQVWFGLIIETTLSDWNRITTKGGTQAKYLWYEEQKEVIALLEETKPVGVIFNGEDGDSVSCFDAFYLTHAQLRNSGIHAPGFFEYLAARKAEAHSFRNPKEGISKHHFGIDKEGDLAVGGTGFAIAKYSDVEQKAFLKRKRSHRNRKRLQ